MDLDDRELFREQVNNENLYWKKYFFTIIKMIHKFLFDRLASLFYNIYYKQFASKYTHASNF